MDRILLILDLDETLFLASSEPHDRPADFRIGRYHVLERPGVRAFLADCAERFELAVWTSSTEDYAADAVAHVFRDLHLAFVWARRRCTRRFDLESHEPYWVKNLQKLKRKGRSLARVLMVDDTARKLESSYGNLVAVRSWDGDPADRELEALGRYLVTLADLEDVRPVEKRGWRRNLGESG